MSDAIATYSFLPWLRQGIANEIKAGVTDNGRAVMSVQLQLQGDAAPGGAAASVPVTRPVALYGPGDITGLDPRAVFRTEPLHWTTNFEPNYLAAIDFYDEDMPWRYTPAAPDGNSRLQPWLALVVLEEREKTQTQDPEFVEGKDVRDKPLPYIEVADASLFPPAEQLWAWSHVHVNRSLAASESEFVSTDIPAIVGRLQAVLHENPDLAYARLLCPRKLDPNKGYHAFLIPSFESGRRAGLGLDPYATPALPAVTTSAWAAYQDRPEPNRYPVYFRWYFHTGGEGDFESLVRLLQPKLPDHRVGRRDLDVQKPGLNVHGVQEGRTDLGGILKLGGALQIPDKDFVEQKERDERDKYEQWATPYPQPIQKDLARVLNLADDYAALDAENANQNAGIVDPDDPTKGDPDPVITPPLYGTWHAMTKRVLTKRDGTDAPNRTNWVHELNLDPRFRVAAGIGTRVVQDQQESLMNAAWQQLGRVLEANRRIRHGHLALAASTMWHERHLRTLAKVNRQKALLVIAPLNKRVTIEKGTVHQQLTESPLQPAMTSPALRRAIRPRGRVVRQLPFSEQRPLDILLDLVNEGEVSAAPPKRTPDGAQTTDKFYDATARPKLDIDEIPPSDFTVRDLFDREAPPPRPSERDSEEAIRYKQALRAHESLLRGSAEAGRKPPKRRLDLEHLSVEIVEAIEPRRTIPKRVMSGINLPERVKAEMTGEFVEAMAYPEIDVPMYEPLKKLGNELLLPNINFIAQNSVTLLETNQKFIEAYMTGLNHEFARELLWREYPTDQRGSYFRQFWDVSNYLDTDGLDPATLKEKLRDITRLDHWDLSTPLGTHPNRATSSGGAANVVLVIRGELLKRYPTAVIYAHRAAWQKSGGTIDRAKPRVLETLTSGEEAKPPRNKVRTPLYDAKVDPDIYFFGFDLTVDQASGDHPTDDPGWFFVIKERPGEPRFGLDLDKGSLGSWNGLSWKDVDVSGGGAFLQVPGSKTPTLAEPGAGTPEHTQWSDDKNVAWSSTMSSADLAYILFQAPVLVAIHASELLPHD